MHLVPVVILMLSVLLGVTSTEERARRSASIATCRNVVYSVKDVQQSCPQCQLCKLPDGTTVQETVPPCGYDIKQVVDQLQQEVKKLNSRLQALENVKTSTTEVPTTPTTPTTPKPSLLPEPTPPSGFSANWTWYQLPLTSDHRQFKFLKSGVFVVPSGVTKVDVIAIGGGGGGRDGHSRLTRRNARGGTGGKSSFGYLFAMGGQGANEDDTGGAGGWGSVASGGQGGKGGGCSAGAGAAGETSPGDGALKPGSSTHPFCGGGASSAGQCSSATRNIAPGKSGPGGTPPISRRGGNYGGGGGGRAGGRTGGGGGYSRGVLTVKPGDRIPVVVGKAGQGYATPGAGIVVVSVNGPVDPSKPFVST